MRPKDFSPSGSGTATPLLNEPIRTVRAHLCSATIWKGVGLTLQGTSRESTGVAHGLRSLRIVWVGNGDTAAGEAVGTACQRSFQCPHFDFEPAWADSGDQDRNREVMRAVTFSRCQFC